MRTKGKGRKAVRRIPNACGSIVNGIQYNAVRDISSHCISKIPPRLPVERDFLSPCEKIDPSWVGDFKKDEQDIPWHTNEETSEPSNEVEKIVGLYRKILGKLLRENDKLIGRKPNIHQNAALLLGNSIGFLNAEKRIGSVPGVEIGDEFHCRAELYIVGLHLQFSKGIDYMVEDGTTLATSVVASNRYANIVNSCGDLVYVGEGGNPMVGSHCHLKDQVMKRGNLALKNSMNRQNPIRVIRKYTSQKMTRYVYDGLYLVQKYWPERGPYNKYVFKFQFRRIPGQPRNPHGFPCKSSEYLLHKQGIIMKDLSRGKEKKPIVVVNTIDDERPSGFTYTVNSTFAQDHACVGCDCGDGGCSDSEECSCKVMNGRKIAYDYDECLVTRRPFIYECGPSCKCFDSCLNKVSQRGIRFVLEVFKTESKGWGARSRESIPSGSFVCEYVGEILKLNEVNQHGIRDNEYLFIMGNNKNDSTFGDSSFFEDDEVLAIDAARKGNVGRFINHSCSPNLCVQNVYIAPHVKAHHIMLFAMKDINPFEELTYGYNCRLGYKNWNFKPKNCSCGSSNCVGKFY